MNVIYSDDMELLQKERAAAREAGVNLQTRDLRAFTPPIDAQFRNGNVVIALKDKKSFSDVAKQLQKDYEAIGASCFDNVKDMLKATPTKKGEQPVEGVDKPAGTGTAEDF